MAFEFYAPDEPPRLGYTPKAVPSQAQPQGLGMRGPQYDRGSFSGPPKPPSLGPMPTPQAPTAMPGPSGAYDRGLRVAQGLRQVGGSPVVQGAMKVGGAASALYNAKGAVDAAQAGDTPGAILSGLKAGAATASAAGGVTPLGWGGMALGGGLAAGEAIQRNMSPDLSDKIGSMVNKGLRLFGGGVDDSAMQQVEAGATGNPAPGSAPSATASTPGSVPAPAMVPAAGQPAPVASLRPTSFGNVPGNNAPAYDPVAPSAADGATAIEREQRAAAIQSNIAMQEAGMRDRGDAGAYTNGPPGATSFNPGFRDEVKARNDKFDREQMASRLDEAIRFAPLGGRNAKAGIDALSQQMSAAQQGDTQRAVAGLREQGETARSNASIDANLKANERNANVTLRGQDLTLTGHQLTAQNARALARVEQFNKDRQYQLEVSKFGKDQADQQFKQREEADKGLTSKLESMFTTKDDKGNAVVDKDAVASHKSAINAYIGNQIDKAERAAQQYPAGSPEARAAASAAEELRAKGAAALGPERLQMLIAQLGAKRASAENHSKLNPFGGTHIESDDPSAYDIVGKDEGIFQNQYRLRNGGSVPTRALDYSKGGGAIAPNDMVDTRTDRYDIIKQRGMR